MIRSVLVIDDDPLSRLAIAATLEDLGYQVLTAENGREGLDLFAAEPTDVVITDIYMPEKDGIEVIIGLREHLHIPKVIAISGGGELCGMDVLRMAKLLGADETMIKPLSLAKLGVMVAELLGEAPMRPRPALAQPLRQSAA